MVSTVSSSAIIPSSMTWLLVFIPALGYFLSTRVFYSSYNDGSSSSGSTNGIAIEMGTIISDRIICYDTTSSNTAPSICCNEFSNFFYLKECSHGDNNSSLLIELLLLKNGLRNVQNQVSETVVTTTATTRSSQVPLDTCDSGNGSSTSTTGNTGSSSIVDIQWIHDNDIGRGYLLYSIENKIWRWEKGGGPIPIGRTLHLDNAGCRSSYYISCTTTGSTTTSSSSSCNSNTNGASGMKTNMVGGISIIQKYTSTSFTDTATTTTNNKDTSTTTATATVQQQAQQQKILSTSKLITDNLLKSITISEWGEGRIVRLESETGARTPLLYYNDIPIQQQVQIQHQHYSNCTIIFSNNNADSGSINEGSTSSSLNINIIPKPERILYTPDGHLLVVLDIQCEYNDIKTESEQMESRRNRRTTKDDTADKTESRTQTITTSIIVQVSNAIHIPPLVNLKQSRIAHSFTTINYTAYDSLYTIGPPKIIYFNKNTPIKINSIALRTSGQSLYMTVQQKLSKSQQQETIPDELLIQELSIVEIDDDADDDDNENDNASTVSTDGTGSVIEEAHSNFMTTSPTAITVCNVSNIIQTMIQHQQHQQLMNSELSSFLSPTTIYQIGDIVVSQSGTIIVSINTDHYYNYVMIIKKKKNNNLDTMKEGEQQQQQQQWISSFLPIQSTNKVDFTGSITTKKESSSSSSSRITALEIGTDGYLYIAISSHLTHSLNRIRIKDKPIQ